MGDVHQSLLGTALRKLDKLAEETRTRKSLKPIDKHLQLLQHGESTFRNEIIASHWMKHLTAKFGSRGKTPKYIFLQAFEEELRGGSMLEIERLKNGKGLGLGKPFLNEERDADEKEEYEDEGGLLPGLGMRALGSEKNEPTMTEMLLMREGHLGPIIERPAAMVSHSVFLRKLEAQLKLQYHRLGCSQPAFETAWQFDEAKSEVRAGESVPDFDTLAVQESSKESEDALLRRLKLIKRGFSALILHFEPLRPVLRDIKKCYDHVLNVRDEELREAKITKQNVEHYKKIIDVQYKDIEFEDVYQLAQIQESTQLLLKHIEKQKSTIGAMSEILNYLETELSEEHDLRHDAEDQQKLLLLDINEYRHKLGMPPRPVDYNSDIAMRTLLAEMAGDKDNEEENEEEEEVTAEAGGEGAEEDKFSIPRDMSITVQNDVIILRRALELAKRDLKEAEARIATLEKETGDAVPRRDVVEMKKAIVELEKEHENMESTLATSETQIQELQEQIDELTEERTRLNDEMAELREMATSEVDLSEFIDADGMPIRKILKSETRKPSSEELTEGESSEAKAPAEESQAGAANEAEPAAAASASPAPAEKPD